MKKIKITKEDWVVMLNGFATGFLLSRGKFDLTDILMYVICCITFFLYGKKEKPKPNKFAPKHYVIFNIEVFNAWFNDKDNNATYAHSGIYLRTDKLSESHIFDYLIKCHGFSENECSDLLHQEIYLFYQEVMQDWINKNNKN